MVDVLIIAELVRGTDGAEISTQICYRGIFSADQLLAVTAWLLG